jgi:hypothetical protein
MNFATPELPVLMTVGEVGPGRDNVPDDYSPSESDYARIEQTNLARLEAIKVGDTISIAVAGLVVLIGWRHDEQEAAYLQRYVDDLEEGTLYLYEAADDEGDGGGMCVQVQGISEAHHQEIVGDSLVGLGWDKERISFS